MKLTTKQKAFTIIEVMIILAIAGLIMVIVFMAVPVLQRNTRNNQRRNDMARIVAALQEYQNTYGGVPRTNSYGEANSGGWDKSHEGDFMQFLDPFMNGDVPIDPVNIDDGLMYYRYYCYPPRGVTLNAFTEPDGRVIQPLFRSTTGQQFKCLP